MLVILTGVITNFFNHQILTDNIVQILIVLNSIPLTSFIIAKASGRDTKTKASLVCPECNGKMKSIGNWRCTGCEGTFKQGKKVLKK